MFDKVGLDFFVFQFFFNLVYEVGHDCVNCMVNVSASLDGMDAVDERHLHELPIRYPEHDFPLEAIIELY